MCHQLPQCDVELFVYAATEWQRQNGKLWGRQIFDSIYASKDVRSSLQYNLLTENLIVEITLKERMYISPDTHHSPSCPSAPKVLIPVRADDVCRGGHICKRAHGCVLLFNHHSRSHHNSFRVRAGTNKPTLGQLAVARGSGRGEQLLWLRHQRHRYMS